MNYPKGIVAISIKVYSFTLGENTMVVKGHPMIISSVNLTKKVVSGMALRRGELPSCVTIFCGLMMVCMFLGEYSKIFPFFTYKEEKGQLIIKMSGEGLLGFSLKSQKLSSWSFHVIESGMPFLFVQQRLSHKREACNPILTASHSKKTSLTCT